ncbi:S-layer homology domain-containing protein [Brevibacillus migulae]|uniref:S-layer homology domain-containing protein n=1 Tax=Brevibacillus migulae TaxID=1644114 RepID=UPI001431C93A|nr:S-layer homology domain-containing protein [Brevibacillus migulae]
MTTMKRWLTVFAAFLVMWATVSSHTYAASSAQINQTVERTIQYLQQRYTDKGMAAIDDWSLIGLALTGEQIPSKKWGERAAWQAEWKKRLNALDARKTTDYARFILTLIAAGEDPAQFSGRNLADEIKKAQLTNGKFADQLNGQGQELINAHVWSIIALYTAGEQIPRAKLAKSWLVSKQLPDGGYQYATGAKTGGVDMTAMTLLAFRALGMKKEEAPVQKALGFLRRSQDSNGGYKEGGVSNAESAANVISALVAWGEPLDHWKKGAANPADALLSFQHATGGFRHTKTGMSNQIATAQSLLALSDLKRGASYLTYLRDLSGKRKTARLQDLSPSHWAYAEMNYMVKEGYLQGVTSTYIQPEARVTRAQFAALLLRVVGEEAQGKGQGMFRDVGRTDWTAPVVEKAAALGLMQGSAGLFRPHQGITQEEMAVIVSRVAKKMNWNRSFSGADTTVDYKQVSSWAKAGVQDLQARKLLGGTATKAFHPKEEVTRAQAAVILYRLVHTR